MKVYLRHLLSPRLKFIQQAIPKMRVKNRKAKLLIPRTPKKVQLAMVTRKVVEANRAP